MNALIIANRLPFPLDDGWKVRTWHVVRAVASCMPTTLAVADPGNSRLVGAAVESFDGDVELALLSLGRRYSPARLLAGVLTPYPVLYWNEQTRAAHHAVRTLAASKRFTHGISVLTFMLPYLRHLAPGARRVVDTHNVDSLKMHRYVETLPAGPRRLYAALTARKLRAFEAKAFAAAESWVCSPQEVAEVRRIVPTARVEVVPNGVDTTRFAPADVLPIPNRLLFFGRLDYFPNTQAIAWFVRDILPLVRREVPEAHLEVVGQGASSSLGALLEAVPGATLRGPVDDVPAVLARASVVVVPLQAGGGTRLKILEALGSARPVVSTTVGAEGLDVRHGEDLLIADSTSEFAAAVVGLLRDPARGTRLGGHGRATVARCYDWALVREQVADLLTSTAPDLARTR